MAKYRLYFKDIDPDTGDLSQVKDVAILECEEKSVQWIKHCLWEYDQNPNRDFYYEKIKEIQNNKMKKSIELLNSEGPILVAQKREEGGFTIIDQYKKSISVLNEREIQSFVHGDMIIGDSQGKYWKYSDYPGSMKPNLKDLDEFIGIDTTGKTY